MSDIKYWLWLANLKGLGLAKAHKYLYELGSAKELYYASAERCAMLDGVREKEIKILSDKNLAAAENIEENCRKLGIRILSFLDAEYPAKIKNIYEPPLVLYIKGALPNIDNMPTIAVVGTRKASQYGRKCAAKFGLDIAQSGGIVISGLAEGIDSEAIGAALKTDMPVIGVLGTGIDVYFPSWNKELQDAVARNGALISEYPPGSRGSRISFPQRNRIISGLSDGVVVIEAPKKSGALITATHASEQGRDVYVVPGNIDNEAFVGSNLLIRDGASLVTCAWDVLSCYRWHYPEKIRPPVNNKKSAVLNALKQVSKLASAEKNTGEAKKFVDNENSKGYIDLKEAAHFDEKQRAVIAALAGGEKQKDEIIRLSGLDASQALAAITMLELEGIIRESEGGLCSLAE